MRASEAATQLSFDSLLTDGADANLRRKQDRLYGHLPSTMEAALLYFRGLLQRHHEAMMAGDVKAVQALRQEAHDLAFKLNNYERGILADEQAPGRVLEKLAAAKDGDVPLWGQAASFEIRHAKMRVRVKMDGLFGIGATAMTWLGFWLTLSTRKGRSLAIPAIGASSVSAAHRSNRASHRIASLRR
jgi:hypothetical protein